MLLSIALLCIMIIGYQGLSNGKKALTDRIYSQLTSVRESKRAQIQTWLKEMQSHTQAMAIDHSIVTASREFTSAYHRLKDETLTPEQLGSLRAYYSQQYLPQLSKKLKITPQLEHFFPNRSGVQYLQYHYISQASAGNTHSNNINKDKSYYAGVHQYYHPVFKEIIEAYGIEDMFLVDVKTGDIVYSTMKNIDFARNLYSGAFSVSNLGDLAKKVRDTQNPGKVSISDFDFYKPAFGRPAAFMGTTVFDDNQQAIAILMIRVPMERLNNVMTGGKGWKDQGLGNTGEAFLVGNDLLMRSNARLLYESKECYANVLAKQHLLEENTAERICQLNTTVLLQKVSNPALKKALQGQSGTQIINSYSGEKTLVAYAPLLLEQLQWAIMAQIDLKEANLPIRNFQKELSISAVIIATIVTLIAMVLAYLFTRPIAVLMAGVKELSEGNTDVKIKLDRQDEYGQLAQTFNHTASMLNKKKQIISTQSQQYDRLLKNILPEKIADKYTENPNQNFSEKVEQVTVLQTSLDGFQHYLDTHDADDSIELLHNLVSTIDELAKKQGVEKIKTIGASYLAACGLTAARLNHAQRCVDFSVEILQLVQQFNRMNGTSFSLRVGMHTGEVVTGVIGSDKICFDVLGEPVLKASRIRYSAIPNSIVITEAVYHKLADTSLFVAKETINTKGMGKLDVYIYTIESEAAIELSMVQLNGEA